LLGLFGWFWLTDKPAQASWLSDSEKKVIISALAVAPAKSGPSGGFGEVLRDPRVYIAALTFFCINSGSHTATYWMPTLIRGFGVQDMKTIGMLCSLPFIGAFCGMYLLARSSDKHQERRWHVGLTMLVSAGSFFLVGFAQASLPLTVLLLSLGAAATFSAISLFWTIPPALLSPAKAAGGIALINSMSSLSGMVSQMAVGAIKAATGSLFMAFDVIAAVLVLGALVLLIGIPARLLHERRSGRD
jgi:predicted MFS family arabinose efflux permease